MHPALDTQSVDEQVPPPTLVRIGPILQLVWRADQDEDVEEFL